MNLDKVITVIIIQCNYLSSLKIVTLLQYMRLEDDDSVTFVNHNEEEDDFDRGIQEILPRNQK